MKNRLVVHCDRTERVMGFKMLHHTASFGVVERDGTIAYIALVCMLAACDRSIREAERAVPNGGVDAVLVQGAALPLAAANDNRTPAGSLRGSQLQLRLDARQVAWRPDKDTRSTSIVLAFAEEGRPALIPGPLLRVRQGTEVRISVRNSIPDSAHIGLPPIRQRQPGVTSYGGTELVVHGIRAGTVPNDTLHVRMGAVREVRFRATRAGTFLYWGAMSRGGLDVRTGTDAQLTGAIVVDPSGTTPEPNERIFVITMTDAFPDSTKSPPGADIFEPVINGLSWPHTERLHYALGDTVRWRWVNGTFSEHPMHLHGFHFRTIARGDGIGETIYAEAETQLAVTELMEPGGTLRMEWVPMRAGNWLMHCHLVDHIVPFPARTAESRAHVMHDVRQHALTAMAGLVLGITVADQPAPSQASRTHRHLRLVAREDSVPGRRVVVRRFELQDGRGQPLGAAAVPGPPLVLTRGVSTAITVINAMREATTVHWHGMELESVFDGVAGWSRTGTRVAPLVAPGDSFRVFITPPRAGTFMYHTHMDETDQLRGGLYGPLLVLEPGEVFNPEVDRVFVIGSAVHDGEYSEVTINGKRQPAIESLRAGVRYRLRIINISPGGTVNVQLTMDAASVQWRRLANDGAALPERLQVMRPAHVRLSAGQTYDFVWTPTTLGEAALVVDWPFPTEPGNLVVRQRMRVR